MQTIIVNSTYTGSFGTITTMEPTTITVLEDATGSVLSNFITNPLIQLPKGILLTKDFTNTNYFTKISVNGTVQIILY
jgi:hypothetical protein